MQSLDEKFMARALELAKLAWGQTHPNPMVGAVIVKNGKIISEGYHKKDGEAHAEINAIRNLKEPAEGAEIYVTLEPCSTKGRTGACCDAIIANKFKRVIIGTLDPNPLHSGRALDVLKKANIEVKYNVLKDECENLNFIFNYTITHKTALLAIKYAQTKNGKIALNAGQPSRITEEAAREHAMHYRKLFPAIAVGFGTLVSDNPSLTFRSGNFESSSARFVFDRSLKCDALNLGNYKLFSDKFKDKSFIVCDANSPQSKIDSLRKKGLNVVSLNSERDNDAKFWKAFKDYLFVNRLSAVIVEGGSKILSSIANSHSQDYVFEYTSDKVFPDSALPAFDSAKPQIENPQFADLAPDTCKFGFAKK